MKKKVLVAMSGGVDSSVTAAVLKDSGWDVVGVTMKLIDTEYAVKCSNDKSCCGYDSVVAAKRVAAVLNIPHYVLNSVDIFNKYVIDNFIDEYKNGRTPNPCNRCNEFIKFDYLIDKMKELGCDFLATGHYARIENNLLYKGKNEKKDQSYFLYSLYKKGIKHVVFPLANIVDKKNTRELAAKFNLPVANKKESQDICFVENGKYTQFLSKFLQDRKGDIVDVTGKKIGEHSGVHKYTIGQRNGLGAFGKRMYVKSIIADKNILVVAAEEELYSCSFIVKNIYCGVIPDENCLYDVKIRYAAKPVKCKIEFIDKTSAVFKTSEPVKSVTPGQSAVVYDGELVVCGGIIENVLS